MRIPLSFRFSTANAVILLCVVLATQAVSSLAATITWVGSTSSDWFNADNWSPQQVPANTDTVVITNGVADATAPVNIAALQLSGGTLGGTNTLVATNGVWAGGTMAGTGVTLIPVGGQWQISGSTNKLLADRTLANAGTVVWSGGDIHLKDAAEVSNLVSGTFEVAFDGTLVKDGFGGWTVYNAGLWRKSAGSGTNTIADTFNNTGMVEVQNGTMKLGGGGGGSGGFALGSGTVLEFSADSYTLNEGAGISGSGLVRVTGATVNFNSTNLSVAGVEVTGGAANFNAAASLPWLEVTGGAANFNADSVAGQVQLTGGTLGGTNRVVATNGVWAGGTMAGTGVTLIPVGGQWQISGSTNKLLADRTLANAGTVVWSGGDIHLKDAAEVSNLVSGTFEVAFDGTLVKDGFGGWTVYNAGLWRKSVGSGTNTIADTFNNTGMVEVQNGTMKLGGGGGGSGGFALGSGTVLEFSADSYTLNEGAGISGSGLVRVTGATVNFNSTNLSVAGVEVTGGAANFNAAASLPWLEVTGGAANFNADSVAGQVQLMGGTLGGTNRVVATNGVWAGGTMAGTGVTLIPVGGQWQISGSTNKLLADRTLANAGTVVWSDGEIHLKDAAEVSNLVSGTFEVAFDGTLVKDGFGGWTVYNAGLWRKSAGTGTTLIADDFQSTGTVEVERGTLYCSKGYTQAAAGTLRLELGGTSAGSQYGQLAVNETANLDGTLQVSLANDFIPSAGDFFVVMTYPARSGSFASDNAATLGLNTFYSPTNLVLIAGNNALPTVTLSVANGNTQTVCQPFSLLAQAEDVDGYVTNLVILQDGLPLGSTSGSTLSTPAAIDCPRVYSFTVVAQDNRGGTTSVTQAVTVAACPLHVLNLGGFQTDGAFKLCMVGMPGSNYQVLASGDLNPTNWSVIGVMEFTNGIWRYLDYAATNHAQRHYRAKQLP